MVKPCKGEKDERTDNLCVNTIDDNRCLELGSGWNFWF